MPISEGRKGFVGVFWEGATLALRVALEVCIGSFALGGLVFIDTKLRPMYGPAGVPTGPSILLLLGELSLLALFLFNVYRIVDGGIVMVKQSATAKMIAAAMPSAPKNRSPATPEQETPKDVNVEESTIQEDAR